MEADVLITPDTEPTQVKIGWLGGESPLVIMSGQLISWDRSRLFARHIIVANKLNLHFTKLWFEAG